LPIADCQLILQEGKAQRAKAKGMKILALTSLLFALNRQLAIRNRQ
jgi:hypothetical protein